MTAATSARPFLRLVVLFATVANLAAMLAIHGERAIVPYVDERIEDRLAGAGLASDIQAYGRAVMRLHVALDEDRP